MSRKKSGRVGPAERRLGFSEDLVWGTHPVLELLRSQPERVTELVLQKAKQTTHKREIIDSARASGVKCSFVERIIITGSLDVQVNHQGVVARTAPMALLPFDELTAAFAEEVRKGNTPKVLVCDCLQDPHNLGAVIRSAYASGVDFVLLTRERSAPLGGTAAKASAGALAKMRISQVTNLVAGLQALKEAGAWVYGAVNDETAQSLYETDFQGPACIIVGNEARGIRPLVRRHCDILISIPMAAKIDSLNSSVAGAVILFEMYRQTLLRAGASADPAR